MNLTRRIWVLKLLSACYENGLSPLPQLRLHRFMYLANVMAPLFEIEPLRTTIVKHEKGPYYAETQWDIDRLVAAGLVNLIEPDGRFAQTEYWVNAQYSVGTMGYEYLGGVENLSSFQRTLFFLSSVAMALAELDETDLGEVAMADANYRQKNKDYDSVIDFGAWLDSRENKAVKATDRIDKLSELPYSLNVREKLHVYFDYLGIVVSSNAQ